MHNLTTQKGRGARRVSLRSPPLGIFWSPTSDYLAQGCFSFLEKWPPPFLEAPHVWQCCSGCFIFSETWTPYFGKPHTPDCAAQGSFCFPRKWTLYFLPRRGFLHMQEREGIKGNYTPTVKKNNQSLIRKPIRKKTRQNQSDVPNHHETCSECWHVTRW